MLEELAVQLYPPARVAGGLVVEVYTSCQAANKLAAPNSDRRLPSALGDIS